MINNDGDVVVPLDLRNFGYWLKLLLGAPVTTQGVAASGSFTFDGQPANNGTISIGGEDWTFVSSGFVGAPQWIAERMRRYEDIGVELFLLHFHPMQQGLETLRQTGHAVVAADRRAGAACTACLIH